MDRTPDDEGVIHELQRRRVFRVAVAYVALSFGVISTGALLLDRFHGPEWGLRALLGASALGFPVAMVLTWVFDVTPTGIVRTPDTPNAPAPPDPAPPWLWRLTVLLGLATGVLALWMR